MVGPDYQRPEVTLPPQWRLTPQQAGQLANIQWWDQFQDPQLSKLTQTALQGNLDLIRATAVVQEYYGRYGVSRSALFPQLGADASYNRYQMSELTSPPGTGHAFNDLSAALGLAWELDFWGRIRRGNEATWADILSQEANRRAVVLSLVSAVASAYLDLRTFDAQLEVSKETWQTRRKALTLMQDRFKAGVISQLDVRQAESEVLTAEAAIPALEQAIATTENALSVLLGQNPGPISRGKTLAELNQAHTIPADLPSQLIEQRPDVVSAEQGLIAANARIGVARAGYFPSISLTGSYGYAGTQLNDWFKNPGQAWAFGPEISLPIFTAGRIAGQVEVAESQKAQALAAYKQSILNAMREVNDALVSFQKTGERESLIGRQVQVLGDYLALSQARYDEGQTSYLEVLDAERRLFEVKLNYINLQNQRSQQFVKVFSSLGGGWVTKADEMTVAGNTGMPR